MNNQRIYAAAELAALAVLFAASIWRQIDVGVVGWVIVAAWLFILIIPISALLRHHNWKESGFRFDNFLSDFVFVGCFIVSSLAILLGIAALVGVPIPAPSAASALRSIFWGLVQEAVLLGYFFQRWRALLQRPLAAAAANALVFGLFHAPDVALVSLASLGSFFFNWLFLRNPNVFLIGIVHGVLSIVALPLLIGTGVMATGRIGPPELAPLTQRVAREWRDGDRLGICSRVIFEEQLQAFFAKEIERVLRGKRDPAAIQDALSRYFASDQRVFCLITERELLRYRTETIDRSAQLLQDWYIWRRWNNPPHLQPNDWLIGLFRDRVLLLSNKAAP
ncbi:MAG: family intrarane metalloprotease [Deltaproteobacteria bacterium]|nr:family intrarane metalloprotease [Deltaproteobacteria bacterium]